MQLKSGRSALVAMVIGLGLSACTEDGVKAHDFGFDDGADSSDPAASTFYGFSWVREGQLAGMPKPGGRRPLDEDLAFLQAQGVQILFSLTTTPTSVEAAAAHGMVLIHLPVQDFTAPTQAQLHQFLERTRAAVDAGQPVGVHCLGGHGRTGTFLAAWFIHEGMSADEALAEIRRLRPGSVETASQEQALHELEGFLSGGLSGG